MNEMERQAHDEYAKFTGRLVRTETTTHYDPETKLFYKRTVEYIDIGRPDPVVPAQGDEFLESVKPERGDRRPAIKRRIQERYDLVIAALRARGDAMTARQLHGVTGINERWLRENIRSIPDVQIVGVARGGVKYFGLHGMQYDMPEWLTRSVEKYE